MRLNVIRATQLNTSIAFHIEDDVVVCTKRTQPTKYTVCIRLSPIDFHVGPKIFPVQIKTSQAIVWLYRNKTIRSVYTVSANTLNRYLCVFVRVFAIHAIQSNPKQFHDDCLCREKRSGNETAKYAHLKYIVPRTTIRFFHADNF